MKRVASRLDQEGCLVPFFGCLFAIVGAGVIAAGFGCFLALAMKFGSLLDTLTPMSAPCTKRQYTKRDAQTMLNIRTRGRREIRRGRPDRLRIYECQKCGHWHLTHQELQ